MRITQFFIIKNKLANTLDELGDLQDFESTATEFYIQALSKDPTSQEKLRAQQTATNTSRHSSDLVIKTATKTLKMINNKMNDEIERKESDDEIIWTPYAASEWSKYNIGEQDNSDMQYLSDQYSSGSDEFSSNDYDTDESSPDTDESSSDYYDTEESSSDDYDTDEYSSDKSSPDKYNTDTEEVQCKKTRSHIICNQKKLPQQLLQLQLLCHQHYHQKKLWQQLPYHQSPIDISQDLLWRISSFPPVRSFIHFANMIDQQLFQD